jgi:cytochrome c peroxidase
MADEGIGAITGNISDMGNFHPPSLRNIAIRAPYMHDGRFSELEQVVEHYSSNIKNHPNLGSPLKDDRGQPRRFKFSQSDKQALVTFLKTLTDQQFLNDPKFSDPF